VHCCFSIIPSFHLFAQFALFTIMLPLRPALLQSVRVVANAESWHVRATLPTFLSVLFFRQQFMVSSSALLGALDICIQLLSDCQHEVRQSSKRACRVFCASFRPSMSICSQLSSFPCAIPVPVQLQVPSALVCQKMLLQAPLVPLPVNCARAMRVCWALPQSWALIPLTSQAGCPVCS